MDIKNYYKNKFSNFILEEKNDPPKPTSGGTQSTSSRLNHLIPLMRQRGGAGTNTGPSTDTPDTPQEEPPSNTIPDKPSWWPENMPWPPEGLNSETIQQWIDPNLGPEFADFAFYSNIENGHGILWVYNPASNSFSSIGPIPILSGPGSINPPTNTDINMPNGTLVYHPEPGQWVFVLPNGEVLIYDFGTNAGWLRLTGQRALNFVNEITVVEQINASYIYGHTNNNGLLRIDKINGNLSQQPRYNRFSVPKKPKLPSWRDFERFRP